MLVYYILDLFITHKAFRNWQEQHGVSARHLCSIILPSSFRSVLMLPYISTHFVRWFIAAASELKGFIRAQYLREQHVCV